MGQQPALLLRAGFDRALVSNSGDKECFLVCEVEARSNTASAVTRTPLNVALVVDVSGSMEGAPLTAARRAAIGVVDRMHPEDRLSLVSFSDSAQVHARGVRMDPAGQARMRAKITEMAVDASTNLADGWLTGIGCVQRVAEKSPSAVHRAIVLSDGHANVGICDPSALSIKANGLREAGFLTSCVGIGEGYSDDQLEAIAYHGGGRLHHAARPEEMIETVLAELRETSEMLFESATIGVEAPAGVEMQPIGETWKVGTLRNRSARRLVVRVFCPEKPVGTELVFRVRAKAITAGDRTLVQAEGVSVKVRYATAQQAGDQMFHPEWSGIVGHMLQADSISRATRLNRDGRFETAHSGAAKDASFLRDYASHAPALRQTAAAAGEFTRMFATPLPATAQKELLMKARSVARGDEDARAAAPASFDEIVKGE